MPSSPSPDIKTSAATYEVANEEGHTELVVRSRKIALRSRVTDFLQFCVEALVLLALLSFAKDCSPILPAFLLPLVFLIYAVPATIGSMYNIVVNRLHKQDLYNEAGKMSYYNRRWVIWFGGFFVAYLVSAVLFVLQAPSWDSKEWLLIWVSIPIFYLVFLIVQFFCKKEYSVKYYKAQAIKWSIVIAPILVTIIYAVLAAQPPAEQQIDLHAIIQDRYLPFSDSPSAFLGEVEKLTTYSDCITQYSVNKFESVSYPVSLIVKLILGFSVFAGIISQLGFCLLNRHEIESVFRLLPIDGGKSKEPIQPKYISILVVIWVVLSGVFCGMNIAAEKIRETNQYTFVDEWIDNTSEWVIFAAEQNIEVVKEDKEIVDSSQDFNERFAQKRDIFIAEHEPGLIDAVNAYYDSCEANVDSYVQWYESPLVSAERFVPIIGENAMKDEFEKQVIAPVSSEGLNERYRQFLYGLKDLYEEYWNSEEIRGIVQQAPVANAEEIISKLPNDMNLWPTWDSEDGKRLIQEVLLGKGENSSEEIRERILTYINTKRALAISLVESLPVKFNLSAQV